MALGAGGAQAQFTSGVNVVEVYASVTDGRGEPVKGLGRDDFELRENGELQQISAFTAADFPLAVAVALDRSFSMAGPRLELAKAGARAFLGELRPRDEAMVIAIGSEIDTVAPLSADRARQLDAVARLDAFGTTGLHDAIISAIDAVQPAKGRRALVLLSDGNDRYSRRSANDALERARSADVMIFPIALGVDTTAALRGTGDADRRAVVSRQRSESTARDAAGHRPRTARAVPARLHAPRADRRGRQRMAVDLRHGEAPGAPGAGARRLPGRDDA